MKIIKKWKKLFLLGVFVVPVTFSSVYAQSALDLLKETAGLVKQWPLLNQTIEQARSSHVKNGRVDTTYCYLSGIQAFIAEILAGNIEAGLTWVPNASSYTDGFVSQQWLSYFYDLTNSRKKWASGLNNDYKMAFYKGGNKAGEVLANYNRDVFIRYIENHVKRYIGRDWYGE